jgi:peptidoglycan/xylan/chitin deacetylase (PgdA/CDA1 family)
MENFKNFVYTVLSSGIRVLPFTSPQVLNYHRIGTIEECRESSEVVCIESSVFTEQMDYLLEKDFYFASLDEIVRHVKGELNLPKKTVAVTFDDGFQDNFKYAYQVLSERNIKATIFINTAFVGKTLPYRDTFWQPSSATKGGMLYKFLSWEEIEIMNGHGIEFEPHTHTHVNLTAVSELQAEEEISISKDIIEKRLGKIARHFSYPYGIYNDRIMKLVEKNGFDAAWAVANENIAKGLNLYNLPRKGTGGRNMTLNRFQVVISSYSMWFWKLRSLASTHV